MLRFHTRYDLLLTPTMPVTALKVGCEMPATGEFGNDWLNWSPYTYPFNLTGQPAASVPCGMARNGLPMGVQIVGPLGAKRRCYGRPAPSSRRCRCHGCRITRN